MSITKEQLDQTLGQITEKFKKEIDTTIKEVIAQGGYATQEQYQKIEDARKQEHQEVKETMEKLDEALKAQGKSLVEIIENQKGQAKTSKTFVELLKEDKTSFSKMKSAGSGWQTYHVSIDSETGKLIAQREEDVTKDPTTHSTVDVDTDEGLLAAVTGSMSLASQLRSQSNARVYDRYFNSNWIFDLVNYTQLNSSTSFLAYWEQQPTKGSPAIVPENGEKPLIQFEWKLVTQEYKKEAVMFKVSQEFSMDFPAFTQKLQSEGIKEVLNKINQDIVIDLVAKAVPFVPTSVWTGANGVPAANEHDAIMAMASNVNNATFSNDANVAIMSTSKYWRIQALKDSTFNYLMPPKAVNQIRYVGNPAFGLDDVIVGDLTQYNLLMRGGVIVKIGLDDGDFRHNRYSTIVEQFYYNYIPAIRQPAIVKGTTFTAVKTAIEYVEPEP